MASFGNAQITDRRGHARSASARRHGTTRSLLARRDQAKTLAGRAEAPLSRRAQATWQAAQATWQAALINGESGAASDSVGKPPSTDRPLANTLARKWRAATGGPHGLWPSEA